MADQENQPVRMAFSVTSARVQHYDGVIDHMTATAVEKFRATHKCEPDPQQVAFLQKQLIRHAVIRHDVNTAASLTINKSSILNEAHRLSPRAKLHR